MKSTVKDATDAAEEAEEDAPEVATEEDSEAPELFNDIKRRKSRVVPCSMGNVQKQCYLDAENDKLDKEQAAEKN